jgi:hypothetical protein
MNLNVRRGRAAMDDESGKSVAVLEGWDTRG